MIALYTETFKEFIDNNAENADWVALVEKMNTSFPPYVKSYDSGEISFYDILLNKFKFREIGRETEELFFNSFSKKFDEVLIKYENKISCFFDNRDELAESKISMSDDEKNLDYNNPSTAVVENLNVQYVTKRERTYNRILAPMTSRPDLIKKIQELESIYYIAVNEFESCFMGCF